MKDRVNIVVTRRDIEVEDAIVVHTTEEATELAAKYDRCMVVGGASIYMQFFPDLERIYVTKINTHAPSTAFFPNLDRNPAFEIEYEGEEQEENGIPFRFCTYKRIE